MNVRLKIPNLLRTGKAGLVCLLILLWLHVTVLASSPLLHLSAHSDAKNPQHQCVVTLVNQGKLLLNAEPDIHVLPDQPAYVPVRSCASLVPRTLIERLPHGRAPPSVSSSTSVAG